MIKLEYDTDLQKKPLFKHHAIQMYGEVEV
jgi:hypothetical protein